MGIPSTIMPFALQDLFMLAELQKVRQSLCPVEALTHPRPPIWQALTSFLAFEDGQTLTYVLNDPRRDGKPLRGFVQGTLAANCSEMVVHTLSPRLDTAEDVPVIWHRLLNYLVAAAGERGVQRVFSNAGEGSAELDVLQGTGFNVYTREDLFCRPSDARPRAPKDDGIRRAGLRPEIRSELATDGWNIGYLYRAVAPRLVQQAEAMFEEAGAVWCNRFLSRGQGEGFILEDGEGIAAYGHLTPGRTGHWLTLLVHPRAYDRVDSLLDYGLALLSYYPSYPLYCTVREYQGGVRALLEERGFGQISMQCCLVKHTTARVQEPAMGLVPALENRAQSPTTTVSPGAVSSSHMAIQPRRR